MAALDTDMLLINEDLIDAQVVEVCRGLAAVYTARCPGKSTANEDAAGIVAADESRGVLVVADGFGGQPSGAKAADLAITSLVKSVHETLDGGGELQSGILAGIDQANKAVQAMGVGAATTLAVLEINEATVRPYHVGDSEMLIVGQRGKIRFQTIAHSPAAYGVQAGMIDESEAMRHADRHLVLNMVGSPDMRIDVGPLVHLRPRDTVVIGTDGLFDNLSAAEITELVRKGNLLASTRNLIAMCQRRMEGTTPSAPSKPDDLTVLVYRLNAESRSANRKSVTRTDRRVQRG